MKTVSYEEFLKFGPCWLETKDGAEKLERIGKHKERWTALDVLNLPEEEVSAEDKLWAVLREEFIEPEILHEFACRCAERAMALVENPDPRSIAAIEAKRRWLRGEIGDDELRKAWDAARNVARDAAWAAAEAAAGAAAWGARGAAGVAARAARAAAEAAGAAARNSQVSMLRELLANG